MTIMPCELHIYGLYTNVKADYVSMVCKLGPAHDRPAHLESCAIKWGWYFEQMLTILRSGCIGSVTAPEMLP
jgi:hypothetical protein